jgi:hypothetical protein
MGTGGGTDAAGIPAGVDGSAAGAAVASSSEAPELTPASLRRVSLKERILVIVSRARGLARGARSGRTRLGATATVVCR